jgi:hypothetical protein
VAKKKKKWIQKAGLKKGSFTSWCKRQGFGGTTSACIAAGKRSKNATIRKRANLASTLRRLPRKRRKKQK